MNLTYEKRGPGKFDDSIDEWVYEQSMDGCDEEAGSVDEGGWYGLLLFDEKVTVDDEYSKWSFIAAIICEDSQGFIHVDYFDDEDKANEAWAAVELIMAGMDEGEDDEDPDPDDDESSENPDDGGEPAEYFAAGPSSARDREHNKKYAALAKEFHVKWGVKSPKLVNETLKSLREKYEADLNLNNVRLRLWDNIAYSFLTHNRNSHLSLSEVVCLQKWAAMDLLRRTAEGDDEQ